MAKTLKLACREREILRLAVAGNTPKQIAATLEIAIGTVHRRLIGIAAKVGVRRQDVINWAFQNPGALRRDVSREPAIQQGFHEPGCECAAPLCTARRIIAA